MTSSAMFSASTLLLLCAGSLVTPGRASERTPNSITRPCMYGSEPCHDSDLRVSVKVDSNEEYCIRGSDITNDIRRRYRGKGKYVDQGQGDLVVGTVSMLDNCVSHSKLMADRHANGFNNFDGSGRGHQDLSAATEVVGCGLFITGENIAMFSASMADDPAVQCMKQWEESEGHLDNIMRQKEGDYVAVGVYNDGSLWWCTQTFANKGDGSCPRVGGNSGNAVPSSTLPSSSAAPTTAEPVTATIATFAPATTAAPIVAASRTVVATTAELNTPAPSTFATATIATPTTAVISSGTVEGPPSAEDGRSPSSDSAPPTTDPKERKVPSSGRCGGSAAPTTADSKTPPPATDAPSTDSQGHRHHYARYRGRGGMYGYYPYRK